MMEKPRIIPETPGVYIYKDARGRIIYVGKAKNLKKRVSSYFRPPSQLTAKTAAMMSHACSIEFLNTSSEKEALLLEASLIKKHRPHYNIVLRDDKQYVMFRLDAKAEFPRLEIVRRVKKDGARYFGPFTSGLAARETLKVIQKTFALRRCSDRSMHNRSRPCLDYHIGRCHAPCTGGIEAGEYAEIVRRVLMLLEGKSAELLEGLALSMNAAADRLDFEKAAELRDQMEAVRKTVERQGIVLEGFPDMDVLGLTGRDGGLALGVIFVRGGSVIDRTTFYWPSLGMEEAPELILSFLIQFYGPGHDIPPRIVLPWNPDGFAAAEEAPEHGYGADKRADCAHGKGTEEKEGMDFGAEEKDEEGGAGIGIDDIAAMLAEWRGGHVRIVVARTADDDRLVDIAKANAREAVIRRSEPGLDDKLAFALGREEPVRRVECVDISHTGGSSTKAGAVVFEDGEPLRSDYRAWNIDGCDGDDYAALTLWAERRLSHDLPWPDLMLIDGGKGQVSSVYSVFSKAFEEGLPFALAGIAKARGESGHADRRAGNVSDRIFLPNRSNPLSIKPGSQEILFLQRVRDHAHDFVIGRHRQARAAKALGAELTRLPGIGPATAKLLWQAFKSVDAMRGATAEELAKISGIGGKKARRLAETLKRL